MAGLRRSLKGRRAILSNNQIPAHYFTVVHSKIWAIFGGFCQGDGFEDLDFLLKPLKCSLQVLKLMLNYIANYSGFLTYQKIVKNEL